MNWAVTILASPRPHGPTLHQTLDSLARAGWIDFLVWNDVAKVGQFRSWMAALRRTVELHPNAEVYFMLEDDGVFCRGLRDYLDRTLWPSPADGIAICSPYSPAAYRRPQYGWHLENRGLYLSSGLSWAFPPQTARAILNDFQPLLEAGGALRGGDYLIGEWAQRTGRETWFHSPSLGQHIGLRNSALGDDLVTPIRVADDFIGEDACP